MNLSEIKIILGDEYEDLLQGARIKCIRYEGRPGYKAKMSRTLHNLAVNWIRDHMAQKRGGGGYPMGTDFSNISDGQDIDLTTDVRLAVKRITPDEETASVVMNLLSSNHAGKEDFALALGIPLRTAGRYVVAVKARLRKLLKEYK